MNTKAYYAADEGFILGKHRKVGEPVGNLTDREAKYLVLAGQISDKAPEPEAPAADAPKRSGKGASEGAPKDGD